MSDNFLQQLNSAYHGDLPDDESLDTYVTIIAEKRNLSPGQAVAAMKILVSGTASEAQQAAFLSDMQAKGVTVDELAAFAFILRRLAEPVRVVRDWHDGDGIVLGDTCGTGGGTIKTFNVSTAIMFILAAAGVIVAKHGNRSITSKCGSADVLEALGVKIDMSPQNVGSCISQIGIGFIYAPNVHKAFKNVQQVRKKLGMPTVFNVLGPLCNPAFYPEDEIPACQVLGVHSPDLTGKMADVLGRLNVTRALVVHGYNASRDGGMDELSTVGETEVTELNENREIMNYRVSPQDFGLHLVAPETLAGGDAVENANTIIDILQGRETGPKRDLVLLNAAAGLYVCGKTPSIKDGISLAQDQITSLGAYNKLQELAKASVSL